MTLTATNSSLVMLIGKPEDHDVNVRYITRIENFFGITKEKGIREDSK